MTTSHLTGTMATDRPAPYAKQLFSHWAGRGPVTEEADGTLTQLRESGEQILLRPVEGALVVEVSGPADHDISALAQAVKVHLERFGQRDELDLVWQA